MSVADPAPLGASHGPARGVWAELLNGWTVILAAFLPIALYSLPSYSFGAVIGPLAQHFGVANSVIAAWSLFWSAGAIAGSFLVGWLVDRLGARRVVLGFLPLYGAVLMAQAVAVDSVPMLMVFAFLIGMTCTGLSPISCGRLVADRFDAALGTALGIMAAGTGLAALLGPILMQRIVDAEGWSTGYVAIGVAALALIPIFWLLVPRTPAVQAAEAKSATPIWPILRSRTFIILAIGTFLFGVLVTGVSVNLMLFLGSLGLTRAEAAIFAGAFGLFTIAGRLLTGLALDKIRAHVCALMGFILLGLAACFAALGIGSVAVAAVALSVFGFAVGAESDCLSFAAVRLFGRKVYGRVFGILGIGVLLLGAGIGPMLFASAVDLIDYSGAFALWALLSVASAAAFFVVVRAPYVTEDLRA